MADQAKETIEEAIEGGQLDPDSDSGPTPDNEDSGESDAGGPTPDSSPTDADGSSPDSTTDEQESVEEQTENQVAEEDTAATDQDQDSDEDSSEGEIEEDDYFFEGEYSEYKTPEEARQGIETKDDIIYETKSELEQEREKRQKVEAQLQSLRETMPEDQQKEMVVRRYMRDELGEEDQDLLEMSDEDIEADREKRIKIEKARAKAEARYENELEEAEQEQQQKLQQRRERLDEANNFVTDWVTEDKFDATTSEDRIKLREHFEKAPDDGEYNRAEKAVLLYADYGKDVAQNYLEGIRQDFVDSQRQEVEQTIQESEPEPKPEPQPSSDDPTTEESQDRFESDNPHETLRASLVNNQE